MNQGIPLNKTYNAPGKITIKLDSGEIWAPENYADASQGTLDLVQATAKSSNTAYAQLMMDVGPENVVALAKRMGITSELDAGTRRSCSARPACRCSTWRRPTRPSPTTASTATAYVVTKVTDADGNVLYEHEVDGRPGARRRGGRAGQLRPQPGRRERHRHRRPRSASRWRARRAPPTSTATPGSSATRASSPPRSGWATPTTRPACMKNVHGKSVTGGSFPAQIWQKYMSKATDGPRVLPVPEAGRSRPYGARHRRHGRSPGPTTVDARPRLRPTAPASSTTTAPPSTTTPTTAAADDHHHDGRHDHHRRTVPEAP